MTREEAIRRIQDFMHWFRKDMPMYESLDMAIRILENHDEFMKRAYEQGKQDALSQEPMREFTEEEAKVYSKALDKMYKPTGFNVFDEQKSGKWIKTPKAVMGEGYMWYCSECEYEVYQDSSKPYPSEKYCPNCGAKMESEDLGDYPDTIHNQFDNMTGSMNL